MSKADNIDMWTTDNCSCCWGCWAWDHVADEVHEEPQEPVMDRVGADRNGFSNKPHDTSMLVSYVDHMATNVWIREIVIDNICVDA